MRRVSLLPASALLVGAAAALAACAAPISPGVYDSGAPTPSAAPITLPSPAATFCDQGPDPTTLESLSGFGTLQITSDVNNDKFAQCLYGDPDGNQIQFVGNWEETIDQSKVSLEGLGLTLVPSTRIAGAFETAPDLVVAVGQYTLRVRVTTPGTGLLDDDGELDLDAQIIHAWGLG